MRKDSYPLYIATGNTILEGFVDTTGGIGLETLIVAEIIYNKGEANIPLLTVDLNKVGTLLCQSVIYEAYEELTKCGNLFADLNSSKSVLMVRDMYGKFSISLVRELFNTKEAKGYERLLHEVTEIFLNKNNIKKEL